MKNNKPKDEKHWIMPGQLKKYDLYGAFRKFNKLDWHYVKASKNIKLGDIVYIIVSAPESSVRYKCEVTKLNVPTLEIDDREFCKNGKVNKGPFYEIKKIKEIPSGNIPLYMLRKHGVVKNIQGPQHLYKETLSFIESLE